MNIQVNNKYAIFSTLKNDVIFRNKNNKDIIFCGGIINKIGKQIFNFQKNQLVGYISYKKNLSIELSTNLIFKINDKNNLNLISILPYASYAMKILRNINPKIGQQIIIVGLNIFSVILKKLLKLSGAYVTTIKLDTDSNNFKKIHDIDTNVINGLSQAEERLKNNEYDVIINNNDSSHKLNHILNQINIRQRYYLNQISLYDVGFKDPKYIMGVKYPYSYVRWDYNSNLKYFINLVEKKQIDISYIDILEKSTTTISEAEEFIKNFQKNAFILFKFQS